MKKSNTTVTSVGPISSQAKSRRGVTDWERLRNMKDSEIDFSDIPEQGEDFFRNAIIRMPRVKKMVSIRLDGDVVDWYKGEGPGYQTRMNAVLKAYMLATLDSQTSKPSQVVKKSTSGQTASVAMVSARKPKMAVTLKAASKATRPRT